MPLEANVARLADFANAACQYGATAASPAIAALRTLTNADEATDIADSLHALQLSSTARGCSRGCRAPVQTEALADRATERQQEEQHYVAVAVAAETTRRKRARATQLAANGSAEVEQRTRRIGELAAARRGADAEISELEDEAAQARAARERAERERAVSERGAAPERSTGVSAGPSTGLVTVGGVTVAADLGFARACCSRMHAITASSSPGRATGRRRATALRRANGCPTSTAHRHPPAACRPPVQGRRSTRRVARLRLPRSDRLVPVAGGELPRERWLRTNAGRYGLRVLSSGSGSGRRPAGDAVGPIRR